MLRNGNIGGILSGVIDRMKKAFPDIEVKQVLTAEKQRKNGKTDSRRKAV